LLRAADAQLVEVLPPRRRREWLYARVHRRIPHFSSPRTFNEKVNWRILNDRRPELAWTCDKLAMKQHAVDSGAHVRVPRTIWSGTDVRELKDVHLPARWVLKPTHRSGLVEFGDTETSLARLAEVTATWLMDHQHGVLAEWAYGQARKQLFVEEHIGRPASPPPDYKFFVFDGEPRLVQVDLDRFSGHRRSLYAPDWTKLDVTLNYPDGGDVAPPPSLARMLDVAGQLARGFDFMRVDLYDDEGDVVFGEYTPYPGSGLERFTPRAFDGELGSWWCLPTSAHATRVPQGSSDGRQF
jgi:hypothetical protein